MWIRSKGYVKIFKFINTSTNKIRVGTKIFSVANKLENRIYKEFEVSFWKILNIFALSCYF